MHSVLESDTRIDSWLLIPFLQPQDVLAEIFGKCIYHTLTHRLCGILLSLFSVILIQPTHLYQYFRGFLNWLLWQVFEVMACHSIKASLDEIAGSCS